RRGGPVRGRRAVPPVSGTGATGHASRISLTSVQTLLTTFSSSPEEMPKGPGPRPSARRLRPSPSWEDAMSIVAQEAPTARQAFVERIVSDLRSRHPDWTVLASPERFELTIESPRARGTVWLGNAWEQERRSRRGLAHVLETVAAASTTIPTDELLERVLP